MAFPSNPTDGQKSYQNGIWYKYSSSSKSWLKDLTPFSGASSSANGASGLVPMPESGKQNYFLRGDGIFYDIEPDYSPSSLTWGNSSSDGTAGSYARSNHRHALSHRKMGYDLTVSDSPYGIFRDIMWCGASSGSTVNINNIPWIYPNIDYAEKSLPYWLQKITTFFKSLENDFHYDQLIGAIPAWFNIPYGNYFVIPSSSTDMDNNTVLSSAAPNYATEFFQFVVGCNKARTEMYTMAFTFGSYAISGTDTNSLYPFRLIFQTVRNQNVPSFNSVSMNGGILNEVPRCTVRSTTYSPPNPAFLLGCEPVTIEIMK